MSSWLLNGLVAVPFGFAVLARLREAGLIRDLGVSNVDAAQLAGAFVASAVVYLTYREALAAFDGGVRQIAGAQGTAGIWATYPQPFLSAFPGGFVAQIVGTALLVGVIFGITDSRNSPAPNGLAPVIVGLLVVLIGATFGFNSGYAINPARDFAPRVFTAIAGWGGDVFRAGGSWWWVPRSRASRPAACPTAR